MLSAVRILGVCGSLQAESANLALLRTAAASAPDGVDVVLYDGLRQLPHFDPDTEASGEPPSVRDWRQALADSDAVLFASPEYGHSLPGALKNAIDWVIGSGELEDKVVAITAAAPAPQRRRARPPGARPTPGPGRAARVRGGPNPRGPHPPRRGAAPAGGPSAG